MSVLGALLLDAYRELNSKRLFWIILGLSGFVVAYFASIGFDDEGMSMLFGLVDIDNPMLARDSPWARILYRSIFSSFIVGIWLAWIATILALISTATIFPDFVSGGAIELVLAKPIGRVRLFFLKYLASLLFVLLQVSLFCVGVFLCMGIRLDDWEWRIFAAIPLLVLFYSYLYSVSTLVGVWTRSSLAALLVTFLFWASLFGVNATEFTLSQIKVDRAVQMEEADAAIARREAALARLDEAPHDDEAAAARRRQLEREIATMRAERETSADLVAKLDRWHGPTRVAEWLMPKTSDTIDLLDRWLREDTDVNLLDIFRGNATLDARGNPALLADSRAREVERRLEAEIAGRSLLEVIGTSLAFEAIVLAIACTVFVRRDY